MSDMNDWKISLGVLIDQSSLTETEKKIAKEKVEISADLDINNFSKTKAEMQKQIESLGKTIQTILGDSFKVNDSTANKWAKELLSTTQKIAQEQAKIDNSKQIAADKELLSLKKQEYEYEQKKKQLQSEGDNQLQEELKKKAVLKEEAINQKALLQGIRDIEAADAREVEYQKQRNQLLAEGKIQAQEQAKILKQANTSALKSDNGTYDSQITSLETQFRKLGQTEAEAAANVLKLRTALAEMDSATTVDDRVIKEKVYNNELAKTQNNLKIAKNEASLYMDSFKTQNLSNKIKTWLEDNTAATKKAKKELQSYITELDSGNISSTRFKDIETRLNGVSTEMRVAGKLGKSFNDTLVTGAKKFAEWTLASGGIMTVVASLKSAVENIKEVDTLLTEISKTSNATDSQLAQLGKDSYDTASKYGVTNTSYLTGVQEMNRSGYQGDEGNAMAELSIKAQSAGDMTEEVADSYIIATDAAYKYEGAVDKLNSVLDGQNEITNHYSVDMETMASATEKAGSMASTTGTKIEELSAMIGTIEASTKEAGEKVGTGIKSLLVNLQNTSSSKITGTLDKANASMTEMKDGIEQMRTPIEILKDLAKTYNSLDSSDPLKSQITANIGGKYHANELAALLSNWSQYESMLETYSQGTGSAEEEAEKTANSLEGSLNKLSNSWNELVSDLLSSDELKGVVNILNSLISGADNLAETFDGLPTIITAVVGALSGFKNVGKHIQVYGFKIIVIVL